MSDAPGDEQPTSKKNALSEEVPAMLGGLAWFLLVHFGIWRWASVRALFHDDEEWLIIASMALFVGAIFLYVKIARWRLDRTLTSIEAELDAAEREQ